MPDPIHSELVETVQLLRELQAKATPGPYRAHDHNDMAHLGEDPEKWMGYAWVGRITKQSEPDGRFDAGWLDRDSRKDASKEYRERASVDAHFVAEALNALPALLDLIERLTTAPAGEDADAEVERILAMSDEQILAEADACDLDWARGVKLGIKIGKGITAPSPVARVPDREEIEGIRAEIINTPETADFMAGVPIEATHQRERWGAEHDAGKSPFDWFWLVGYLAQKAADSAVRGDVEKAKHHTISTAAALANWHANLTGADTSMRPGIAPPSDGSGEGK